MSAQHHDRKGLLIALGCYAIWGLLPLYMQLIKPVPAIEQFGWRVLFTVPVCAALLVWQREGGELMRVLRDRRTLGALMLSGLLIGANWFLFMTAVSAGHVLATALGYYINPLVSVLLGTVVLGERLSRLQWTAVAIAGAGILLLIGGALDTLAISLGLAFSFGFYGLVRKRTAVSAITGLSIESAVLVLPALAVVAWYARSPEGPAMAQGWPIAAALAGTGVVTAVPLMLFAMAARRLDLSTLGMMQYLAPTISFLLSVLVLGEALDPLRLASFALIWLAIAVFSTDLVRRMRKPV